MNATFRVLWAGLLCVGVQTVFAASRTSDVLIDGKGVHPESITSLPGGTLFNGSIGGIIYRAGPSDTVAKPFIVPNEQNGLRSVFGVLADAHSQRLWVCSVANSFVRSAAPPAPSELVAFHLRTGELIGRWPFPAPAGVCNDIAMDARGNAYATDTPGGRILRLKRGANALEVVAVAEELKGIDGLDFGADGKLYVNIVSRGELLRVTLAASNAAPRITKLNASRKMEGPDGLRHIGKNRFLQAEGGGGRITLVTISGDNAEITVLREGLNSSPGVTRVGSVAYAVEGKIQYLINPELRGQDPGPFRAIVIPLPKDVRK
jgi:hypothetical protein